MAGRGYSGKTVTTDVRATIAGAVHVVVQGLAVAFHRFFDTVTIASSHQPNSWRNDWSMVCGERVVLVAQDYCHEMIRDMHGLQSGLVLQSSSTHEGLPAILVQIGYRMLAANVRFAMLFSTTVFRLVEIDSRLEQGHTLLVSPAYRVSSEHSGPLLALLASIVLAGLRQPLIYPAPCELEILGPVIPSNATTSPRRSSETEAVVPGSGVSNER
ncbi:hypothetical protein EI94DRAFT_1722215, partial [Lactarius quietus]